MRWIRRGKPRKNVSIRDSATTQVVATLFDSEYEAEVNRNIKQNFDLKNLYGKKRRSNFSLL